LAGPSGGIALLALTNSPKKSSLPGSQTSQGGEGFMSLVRFFASPPPLEVIWILPPVLPSCPMVPSMQAICLPSGRQTGLAICSVGLWMDFITPVAASSVESSAIHQLLSPLPRAELTAKCLLSGDQSYS